MPVVQTQVVLKGDYLTHFILHRPGTFQVVAGGQCGGSGGSCTQLESAQCKDAVWNGAQVLLYPLAHCDSFL